MGVEWESAAVADFLQRAFPHRRRLLARVLETLAGEVAPLALLAVVDRRRLGIVFDRLLGLDLSASVPYRSELSCIPAEAVQVLLEGAGFTGTGDPMTWKRNPAGPIDGDPGWLAQCHLVFTATSLMIDAKATEQATRQVIWDGLAAHARQRSRPAPGVAALSELWDRYLRRGRQALRALGQPCTAGPVMEDPFTADLIAGSTLIEVKAYAAPTAEDLDGWLDQLLKYVLLDREDRYRIDAIGGYSGWHSTLLHAPLADLLPELEGLLVRVQSGERLRRSRASRGEARFAFPLVGDLPGGKAASSRIVAQVLLSGAHGVHDDESLVAVDVANFEKDSGCVRADDRRESVSKTPRPSEVIDWIALMSPPRYEARFGVSEHVPTGPDSHAQSIEVLITKALEAWANFIAKTTTSNLSRYSRIIRSVNGIAQWTTHTTWG